MSTLLNKSYLVKVSTKGEGVKNAPNSIFVVCTLHSPYDMASDENYYCEILHF